MLIDFGPFRLSPVTYTLVENTEDSILEFADFLVPDLPAGNGFSTTDAYPNSNEQAVNQTVTFMNLLSQSPQLMAKGINLKTRPLVLWGVSYGGGYFAWLGVKLAQQGWNLKAALFDSPWASARLSNREFCAAITENNPFHANKEVNKQRLCNLTQNCFQKITSSAGITAEEAFECDEQICEKVGIDLGEFGVLKTEA
jgi:pimeloyl-ACP methyl ester carboxylesterase